MKEGIGREYELEVFALLTDVCLKHRTHGAGRLALRGPETTEVVLAQQ